MLSRIGDEVVGCRWRLCVEVVCHFGCVGLVLSDLMSIQRVILRGNEVDGLKHGRHTQGRCRLRALFSELANSSDRTQWEFVVRYTYSTVQRYCRSRFKLRAFSLSSNIRELLDLIADRASAPHESAF
jgi:hypothetical protein